MTTITAKIIADSVSEEDIRLTTMQLRYPRCIHSEFLTHRVFSRNASSSRAIPVERLIADVLEDPFIPLHWGANQKGMQADAECDEPVDVPIFSDWRRSRQSTWLATMHRSIASAEGFAAAGYHKQIVNRLLEPFAHINVVVTATEWRNFFALRDHKDAEPHIAMLARAMREAMDNSSPQKLKAGQWHLPYAVNIVTDHPVEILQRMSVARCASVSYKTVDGLQMTVDRALDLYDKLFGSGHWSPFEHQATPDERLPKGLGPGWTTPTQHGNFCGWRQLRKTLGG